MPGSGSVPADICFVGEAPGRLGADKTGVPFTQDKSGLLFRRVLSELMKSARTPLRVYVTNSVKCLPATSDGLNRTPSREEMLTCRRHLDLELALVCPKIIVPLGRTASKVVLGTNDIEWWQPVKSTPVVFPAKHPAYVVRGGGRERLTEAKYGTLLRPAFAIACGV